MIPLIEDALRSWLDSRINWLKKNPEQIPEIFGVLGKRTSLKNFQEYVKNTDFKILMGYPREANQVPCFVISLAGEQEVTAGIGDCIDEDIYDDDMVDVTYHVDTIYIDSTYRLEVWSDNSDLAVYMYILAKWAMLVSRKDMLENDFILPRVSGGDLDPVPDYFPIFVYRKALMINFQYENKFFENEEQIEEWDKIVINSSLYESGEIQAKS